METNKMRMNKETKIEDTIQGGHTRPHFVVAIPTFGMVPIEFVVGFSRMQMPINAISTSLIMKGWEIGEARNYFIEAVVNQNPRPKYLLMIGDDMIPPWDGAVKLYEEMEKGNWDVLSGLYYWKGEPPTPLTWRKTKVGPMLPGIDYELGEVVDVDVTGMDFTLIRVESMRKLKPPYFKSGPGKLESAIKEGKMLHDISYKFEHDEKIIQFTEDVFFLNKCKNNNMKVGVDTSIRVAHVDTNTGEIY